MLRNPIQLRLEKFESWQQITFMAALCERMYPSYAYYCEETDFAEPQTYRIILDSVWELLTVKGTQINFESQLEKLEEMIPEINDESIYLSYPAFDACVCLSTLLHSIINRDILLESTLKVSQLSIMTVAQLVEAQSGDEITDENQKGYDLICEEWDIQWALYRPLKESEKRDINLIKDLRDELRENNLSNIGLEL